MESVDDWRPGACATCCGVNLAGSRALFGGTRCPFSSLPIMVRLKTSRGKRKGEAFLRYEGHRGEGKDGVRIANADDRFPAAFFELRLGLRQQGRRFAPVLFGTAEAVPLQNMGLNAGDRFPAAFFELRVPPQCANCGRVGAPGSRHCGSKEGASGRFFLARLNRQ
jgi:hypothetical protein